MGGGCGFGVGEVGSPRWQPAGVNYRPHVSPKLIMGIYTAI